MHLRQARVEDLLCGLSGFLCDVGGFLCDLGGYRLFFQARKSF
jgi:hypothetical protein